MHPARKPISHLALLLLLLLLLGCLALPALAQRNPVAVLSREWKLDDVEPGFPIVSLPEDERVQAMLAIQHMKQVAHFTFRDDSTYTFSMDRTEAGIWWLDSTGKRVLTYREGVSRPDTFDVLLLRPDTTRLRLRDHVRDADYTYTLVPAFSLPSGMARNLVGDWAIGRIEFDARQVPDEQYRLALRRQIDSLRLGSRFTFTEDGYFDATLMGDRSAGRYTVTNNNYLTTIDKGTGGRTSFVISAASPDAILLLSNDPQRTPPSLQLVLTPYATSQKALPTQPTPEQRGVGTGPWRKNLPDN